MKIHQYKAKITWTGNKGLGTKNYTGYERSHTIHIDQKTVIEGSSDPAFRGDPSKHNPEELLLASIASCHMLWYLHLCASHQIEIVNYIDHAEGIMQEKENGSGRFLNVTLYPKIKLADITQANLALILHQKANEYCFIANSLNFPVYHKPEFY